jgi:hypothetical protein
MRPSCFKLFGFLAAAVMFATGLTGGAAPVVEQRYPKSLNVIDVKQPPYSAKGDGVTDDTDALQRALNENVGRHRMLYFPRGTYIVSRTLTWPKQWKGRDNWGFTMLCGQHRDQSILRLKDGTFSDAAKPAAIMWCGGFGSADWFHNYVENLTFDVGSKNAGAIGLQFYANNYGAVRDCLIVSKDGAGEVGLDLGHRDMNGPLLVSRVEVRGFRRGVATSRAVNGQTFEHLTLRGQTQFGFDNEGQSVAIRGLRSENSVPAVRSYGALCMVDSTLTGKGDAAKVPAVINYNGGRLMLRDVATTGYGRAVGDVSTPDWVAALRVSGEDKPGSAGPKVAEYFSHPPSRAYPGGSGSLRLPVEETPAPPLEDPKKWAVADAFGADPTGERDASDAIQKAVDSGAVTLFLPGHYALSKPVIIRGKVQRVLGVGGQVDYVKKSPRAFRIEGAGGEVTFEHLANVGSGIENSTDRTVILRSIGTQILSRGRGTIFFEDVAGHELSIKNQRVFARQLNIENEGTHFLNDGGTAWVLGYKTERGGTLAHTLGGGRSEVIGGFSYTTTAGKLAPMFVTENASLFAFFAEVCYSGDPFQTLVQETRGGETKVIRKGEGHTLPYIGYSDRQGK